MSPLDERARGVIHDAMTQLIRADNEWRFDLLDEAFTVVTRNRRTLEPLAVSLPSSEMRLAAEQRCPFCDEAPMHVLDRVTGSSGREVVALPSPTPLGFVEDAPPPSGPFTSGGALGAHELLVASAPALHGAALEDLDEETLSSLLLAFARRRSDLAGDQRLGGVALALAPPSLSRFGHAHATLFATPFAAPRWSSAEVCPACRELADARARGRLLVEDDRVAAYVPFAPRADVHVRVAALAHGTAALAPEPAEEHCRLFARVLRDVLARIVRAAPGAPLLLRAPALPLTDEDAGRAGHVLLEVESLFPVDDALARGLGVRIVSVPPEELAERLRDS